MLKLFQNQGKVLRWVMGVVLFLVAGSMVITLVPNVFGPAGPASADVLAEVGGLTVTTRDVEVELRQYRSTETPAEAIAMMAGSVVENLIAERVLFVEAGELGLVPSEEDLAHWLREQLPDVLFPDGKFVGARTYEGFVRQQFRRTVAEFEREILYNLTIDLRLKRMVTDGVNVTEEELKRRFHEQNDSIQIEWTAVDGDSLRNEISPTPEQLREYFDSNKLRYRHAERRPLKLMTVAPDAGTSEHEVSETEIELYYSQNLYRFENPERFKVRHILFSTMDKSEDEDEAAREKAEAVLEQLRGGADFAELAQEHSEDPGNADNGGDLGWVTRGMMDPAFEEASFALQTGELSVAPVKSDFGYHLIRLDDRESGSVKPLSEVREVIRGDLKAERAQSSRYALMDNALVVAQQVGRALENAASQLGLPFQEFPAFSRSELPNELPKTAALVRAVFGQPAGEVFSVTQDDTLYIGIVDEAVPARDAQFEEVDATVRQDYIDTESANLARARAEELAQRARDSANELRAAARRSGLRLSRTEFIKRDGEVEEIGPVRTLGSDAFTKTGGEIQGPVAAGNRWIVFRTLELQTADESALATEGEELRATLLSEKRNGVFDYFRRQKLREYSENGLLVRYGDRIQSYLRSMQNVI